MSTREPFEQLNELNQLTTQITQRTTEYIVGAVGGLFNDTAKTWNEFSNVKKIEDVVSAQTRIASEMSNKLLKASQEGLNVWQENAAEIGKFIQNCTHSMQGINPVNMMNPENVMNAAKAAAGAAKA